jgi:putative FmdB family regulatory protein
MPIYEYRCEKCGKVFEVLQRFSDDPLKIHEGCGGEVEKLISHSAFQLKGSGWYVTDYAKGSTPAANASKNDAKENGSSESKAGESKTESSSDSTSDSKSESKTETKTESKPAVTTTTKTD